MHVNQNPGQQPEFTGEKRAESTSCRRLEPGLRRKVQSSQMAASSSRMDYRIRLEELGRCIERHDLRTRFATWPDDGHIAGGDRSIRARPDQRAREFGAGRVEGGGNRLAANRDSGQNQANPHRTSFWPSSRDEVTAGTAGDLGISNYSVLDIVKRHRQTGQMCILAALGIKCADNFP